MDNAPSGTKKKNRGKKWLVKLTKIVYCLQSTNRERETDTKSPEDRNTVSS